MQKKSRKATIKKIREKEKKDRKENLKFWNDKYPKLSIDEKKKVWLRRFYRDIRWQGESTNDEFSIFSRDNYVRWEKKEPEIDLILDYVLDKIDKMYEGNGKITQKINQLIGRKMMHKTEIDKYEGSLKELAEDIGNLRYDALLIFLNELSNKISLDGTKDYKKGRVKLSKALTACSGNIKSASNDIHEAWLICKPYIK